MGFDLGLQMNAFVMLYIDVKCVVYGYFNLFIEITIRNSCFGKIPILPSIQLFFFYKKRKYLYYYSSILLYLCNNIYTQIISSTTHHLIYYIFFTGRTTGIEPARGGFTIHCLGTTWLRPPQTNWQSLSTVIPFQE